MWCTHCQREVTADFLPEAGEIRCGVCGQVMPGGLPDGPAEEPPVAASPFPEIDDWRLQDDLVEARRLLRLDPAAGPPEAAPDPVLASPRPASRRRRVISWTLIAGGALLISYGLGLFVATVLLVRSGLWLWGGLAVFSGQFLLFIGYTSRGPACDVPEKDASPATPADACAPPPEQTTAGLPPWSSRFRRVLASTCAQGEPF